MTAPANCINIYPSLPFRGSIGRAKTLGIRTLAEVGLSESQNVGVEDRFHTCRIGKAMATSRSEVDGCQCRSLKRVSEVMTAKSGEMALADGV
jgi:hypothetical protein